MMILDRKRLECVHYLPLHGDHLDFVSVHILSNAVQGSGTQQIFLSTKSHYLLPHSVPCLP